VLVTKAMNATELKIVARKILRKTNVFLVQRFYQGRDYRVVVLDNHVISAYERLPLSIVGDGRNTVATLLKQLQQRFVREGRDTHIDENDFRFRWKLRRSGYSPHSVIPRGVRVALLDNANLSTGGESHEATKAMHVDYRRLAAAVTQAMCLRLCGVDIITSDITKPLDLEYIILEINGAPGLDHYAAKGKRQQKTVERLYTKVLRAIERST